MSTTSPKTQLAAKPESERTIKFDTNAKTEEGTTLGYFVPYGDTSTYSRSIVDRALKQRSEAKEGSVVCESMDQYSDASDDMNDSADDIETEDESEDDREDDSKDDSGSTDGGAVELKPAWKIRNDSENFWEFSDLVRRNENYLTRDKK